jgi:hypothetical protein
VGDVAVLIVFARREFKDLSDRKVFQVLQGHKARKVKLGHKGLLGFQGA